MQYRVEYPDHDGSGALVDADSPWRAAQHFLAQDAEENFRDALEVVVYWGALGRRSERFLVAELREGTAPATPTAVSPAAFSTPPVSECCTSGPRPTTSSATAVVALLLIGGSVVWYLNEVAQFGFAFDIIDLLGGYFIVTGIGVALSLGVPRACLGRHSSFAAVSALAILASVLFLGQFLSTFDPFHRVGDRPFPYLIRALFFAAAIATALVLPPRHFFRIPAWPLGLGTLVAASWLFVYACPSIVREWYGTRTAPSALFPDGLLLFDRPNPERAIQRPLLIATVLAWVVLVVVGRIRALRLDVEAATNASWTAEDDHRDAIAPAPTAEAAPTASPPVRSPDDPRPSAPRTGPDRRRWHLLVVPAVLVPVLYFAVFARSAFERDYSYGPVALGMTRDEVAALYPGAEFERYSIPDGTGRVTFELLEAPHNDHAWERFVISTVDGRVVSISGCAFGTSEHRWQQVRDDFISRFGNGYRTLIDTATFTVYAWGEASLEESSPLPRVSRIQGRAVILRRMAAGSVTIDFRITRDGLGGHVGP